MARWNVNGHWIKASYGVPLYLTVAAEDVYVEPLYNAPASAPQPRVYAGGGDDTVGGGYSFWVDLGAGNDEVVASGPYGVDNVARWPATIAYGGDGDDVCTDMHGSSVFYGGTGQDRWTSVLSQTGTNHSVDGDVDRVNLGAGNDSALFSFDMLSGPDGYFYENREVFLDGGSGQDKLFLSLADLDGAVLGTGKTLDCRTVVGATVAWGNLTFSGFEAFDLAINCPLLTRIIFGDGNDGLDFQLLEPEAAGHIKGLVVEGGGGNDRILGLYGSLGDTIHGGAGNDTLTGRGAGAGQTDRLFGGAGADILLTDGIEVTNPERVAMWGGSGADWFVLDVSEARTRINDFQRGQDKIVLDGTGGYVLRESNIRAFGQKLNAPDFQVHVSANDADHLLFDVSFQKPGDWRQASEFSYDRDTGLLQMRFIFSAISTSEWHRMAVIEGAPDLTLSDFRVFDLA